MSNFKINEAGMAALQAEIEAKMKQAELEANEAASSETTAEGKARVFAEVLKRYGVEPNEAAIRSKFEGLMSDAPDGN